MITFAPMSPLAALPAARRVCSCLLVVAPLAAAPAIHAQAPLSHTEDAAPLAAGSLRLGITTAWTRYDERFAVPGGTEPLSADLSTLSLGVAQLPLLAPTEASLQTLAGEPAVRLSLGRLEVRGGARIVTTPISLEYGVTRRLSIGVQVPIVQTRRVVQLRVNEDSTVRANTGFVPEGSRSEAAQQNAAVASAYKREADRLDNLIAQCAANPGAAGCAPVNADPAGATAARDQARAYANAVTVLGTDAAQALLAPRAGSALATSIEGRRQAINAALQQFLGAGAGASTGVFLAQTDFSYIDLQGRAGTPGLLQSAFGGGLDSMHTSDRLGIGDVAVGAKFLLFDRFARGNAPVPRLQARMLVGAAVRLATSQADSALDLVDIAPGEGAGVEIHSAMDLITGRFGGTIAARYVRGFTRTVTAPLYGNPEASYPFPAFGKRRRTPGDVVGLDVSPRYFFTDWLSVDGHYGLERVGAATWSAGTDQPPCANCIEAPPPVLTTVGTATMAQRLGVGFRLSTVDAYARGQARYPIEVSFAHL
jgi:hypothetical protein